MGLSCMHARTHEGGGKEHGATVGGRHVVIRLSLFGKISIVPRLVVHPASVDTFKWFKKYIRKK